MKYPLTIALAFACGISLANGQDYTNFVRQIQYPSAVEWDVNVEQEGEQLSPLAINPGGASFELWTVKNDPLTSYLLDSQYVGTYVPIATVTITSEDPYTVIPRTRADRPFSVQIDTSGLLNGLTDPPASKSVTLRRHVQSYGPNGTGEGLNRDQATLLTESSINSNGTINLNYGISSVPGSPLTAVRGEERFSVFSLPDYQAPEEELSSLYVQIWPLATATVQGLAQGGLVKAAMPVVSLTLTDLYPNSQTYAQVYPGDPQLDVEGTIVPGSALVVNDSVPRSEVLTISEWDEVFNADGRWTFEILTATPFGVDRLAYISFDLDRTIKVNGSVTSRD